MLPITRRNCGQPSLLLVHCTTHCPPQPYLNNNSRLLVILLGFLAICHYSGFHSLSDRLAAPPVLLLAHDHVTKRYFPEFLALVAMCTFLPLLSKPKSAMCNPLLSSLFSVTSLCSFLQVLTWSWNWPTRFDSIV